MSTSTQTTAKPEQPNKRSATGLSTGFALGAGLGVTLWLATGQFIFFPIFVGAGLSIGTALDASKNKDGPADGDQTGKNGGAGS